MKLKYLLNFVFICLFFVPVYGQEGLIWWSDLKTVDFIVEGVVTYEPTKYYEINVVNVKGVDKKYYWIVGNIKINKVLFINKNSEHLESYKQYLKNSEKEYSVLIPAYQRATFSTVDKTKFQLHPILGIDITKEATILNLSEIYIFPILDLKLASVVPAENISQARELIDKRPNNLLSK